MVYPTVQAMTLTALLLVSFPRAKAQMQLWGSGAYGAAQACPYELQGASGAVSQADDLREAQQQVKELKAELREAQKDLKASKQRADSARKAFQRVGFEGEAFIKIENHVEGGISCSDYEKDCSVAQNSWQQPLNFFADIEFSFRARTVRSPAGGGGANPNPNDDTETAAGKSPPPRQADERSTGVIESSERKTNASRLACVENDKRTTTAPFAPHVWAEVCREDGGLTSHICSQNISGSRPKAFSREGCADRLRQWIDAQKKYRQQQGQIESLKAAVEEAEAMVKIARQDYRDALKEAQRESRERLSTGDCIDCILGVGGGVYAPRKPSVWEIGAQAALGLGAMYLGNELNKHTTDQNARLGFATQPYPTFGYGYPYFMGAAYGALGGALGQGGFGCMNGIGSGAGPNGMMSPGGLGGPYGANGGAFGYPNGMFPGSGYAGASPFLPGMGPWGANGGMYPGGGMGMGAGLGFGGNLGFGGLGMGTNPGMGGFPGAFGGFGLGAGMGNGFGGPGLGGGMGGFPGAFGGFGLGAGMGNGFGGMGGMGIDPAMMQIQMQQMQMQMQAQQQAMQMQMQRAQQYQAQMQVITGLNQELQTLLFRLEQAKMGLYTGSATSGIGGTSYLGVTPGGSTSPYTNSYSPFPPGTNPMTPTGVPRAR